MFYVIKNPNTYEMNSIFTQVFFFIKKNTYSNKIITNNLNKDYMYMPYNNVLISEYTNTFR